MLAMLLCTSLAMAQSKFNVKGIIIDKETDEALIAASVQLTKEDGTYVTGKATDMNGAFEMKNVKKDKYKLKITYVGYQSKELDLDLTSKKEKNVDMGYLTMSTDAVMLEAATVTAQASKTPTAFLPAVPLRN